MQQLYTPEEVADRLKVDRQTVYLWLRKGALKGYKAGVQWRIPEEAIQEFLTRSQEEKED